ncbi:MAG: peptidyl-tRNA hydrolase Pth2 [Candidatus Aenigmatarchaeota archaeon]
MIMYKQVIVVRSDLKMSEGKLAVQVAHASLSSAEKVTKKILGAWSEDGQKKIVLKVKSLDELLDLKDKCRKLSLPHSLITDAGLTEFDKPTVTALGIGPDDEKKIDKVTGSLPLLK